MGGVDDGFSFVFASKGFPTEINETRALVLNKRGCISIHDNNQTKTLGIPLPPLEVSTHVTFAMDLDNHNFLFTVDNGDGHTSVAAMSFRLYLSDAKNKCGAILPSSGFFCPFGSHC